MQPRQKILLVDDDKDLLNLYQQILAQLPSQPEVLTSLNGARAVAMLEAEPFAMLVCDLRMPHMDGLQLLGIVRKKYPLLRTVVLTSVPDEEFRSRAYAIGVDLFWFKPGNQREVKLFLECLESLLGREAQSGFRGIQNKSLVDIIQLECISNNSLVLRVTNGPLVGKIWIENGEVIDATAEDLGGEVAFKGIMTWRAGSFESLPAEPEHPRAIEKNFNALLLETAQAIDESRPPKEHDTTIIAKEQVEALPLTLLSRLDGAEFVLITENTEAGRFNARGLENPERLAAWSRATMQRFGALAEQLRGGELQQVEALGPQRNAGLAIHGDTVLCMGWRHDLNDEEIRERTRKAVIQWAS